MNATYTDAAMQKMLNAICTVIRQQQPMLPNDTAEHKAWHFCAVQTLNAIAGKDDNQFAALCFHAGVSLRDPN